MNRKTGVSNPTYVSVFSIPFLLMDPFGRERVDTNSFKKKLNYVSADKGQRRCLKLSKSSKGVNQSQVLNRTQ